MRAILSQSAAPARNESQETRRRVCGLLVSFLPTASQNAPARGASGSYEPALGAGYALAGVALRIVPSAERMIVATRGSIYSTRRVDTDE